MTTIFQLVEGVPRWEVDHAKTDIFRQAADYSKRYKQRLREAVREGAEAVQRVANEPALANLLEVESGVVVDLFLSLRDVKAHAAISSFSPHAAAAAAGQDDARAARALNREGRFDEAEKVLKEVIAEFGPSSETNGLLGRIYKDRWDLAKKEALPEARALLKNAIDAYLADFEADWRDAYPGINAVTLMEMLPKPDPRPSRSPARGALFGLPQGGEDARLLGPRHLAGAGHSRAGRRRRRGETGRRTRRRARWLGARDDRVQPLADPGNARGAARMRPGSRPSKTY